MNVSPSGERGISWAASVWAEELCYAMRERRFECCSKRCSDFFEYYSNTSRILRRTASISDSKGEFPCGNCCVNLSENLPTRIRIRIENTFTFFSAESALGLGAWPAAGWFRWVLVSRASANRFQRFQCRRRKTGLRMRRNASYAIGIGPRDAWQESRTRTPDSGIRATNDETFSLGDPPKRISISKMDPRALGVHRFASDASHERW
jgi:hypothetical protein